MPIGSIITQPAANSINAAYRPIVLRVTATNTDATPIPPVVYCDIYLDDVYYKTLSKTQYTKLNAGSNSEWEFDIQDALQEYLQKHLAANGEDQVTEAPLLVAKILCKFRSSGYDDEGFIETEDTAPIQGTDDVGATAGTGTSSNTFYGVNATLQHEDNQDLATHLNSFKHRTWGASTYPLTHRPDRYKLCVSDSDSFPIISNLVPDRVILHYTTSAGADESDDTDLPCTPLAIIGSPLLPDATADVAYNYTINLSGTAPFALEDIVKPAWMTIAIVGSTIVFSGTPDSGDVDSDIDVSFSVNNGCGVGSGMAEEDFSDQIDVLSEPATCTPVTIDGGAPTFPTAQAGTAYNFTINLLGTAPFNVIAATYPTWMTITHIGDEITFTGTPSNTDIGDNKIIDFTVYNCNDGGSVRVFYALRVIGLGRAVNVINDTGNNIELVNSNPTSYIFDTSGGVFNLPSDTFTIQTMVGTNDVEVYDSLLGGPIETFAGRVQGNVITLSNLSNTNYLWFKP